MLTVLCVAFLMFYVVLPKGGSLQCDKILGKAFLLNKMKK